MVGTCKWNDEQILLVFDLYHKKKFQKWQIAEFINQRWPRRGAGSAGVNYVLNTKKKEYFELTNGRAALRAKPSQVAKHQHHHRVAAVFPRPTPSPLPPPATVVGNIYEPATDFDPFFPPGPGAAPMYEPAPEFYDPHLLSDPADGATKMYEPVADYYDPYLPSSSALITTETYEPAENLYAPPPLPPPYEADSIDLTNFDFTIPTDHGYEPDLYYSPTAGPAAIMTPVSSPLAAVPVSLPSSSPLVSTLSNPAPMAVLNGAEEEEEQEEVEDKMGWDNEFDDSYDWNEMFSCEQDKWEEFDQSR